MKLNGLVTKSTGSWYSVRHENKVWQCKIRGKFRIKGIRSTNPIAVGDVVDFELVEGKETGFITKIHERKNHIVRKATNLSHRSHIIASNIDQAVLIVSLYNPVTYPEFIDRFLVSAEAFKIPVSIIFNKIDIYDKKTSEKLENLINIYTKIGYTCIKTSVIENINVDKVSQILKNKVNLIAGNSGVGKSTLVNKIDPELQLKIAQVSDYHGKGKHTTTFAEMFTLKMGGFVIDTPGIKSFGVLDIEKEELSHFFPEIFQLLPNCQYHNCTHTHEPNCAVKEGILTGKVSKSRYNSYISIFENDDSKYRL